MTDQTDYDVTDEDRRIAYEWASHIHQKTDKYTPAEHALARVILSAIPAPPLPTMADMTEEECRACMWMQADVKDYSKRCVITNAHNYIGDVGLISTNGKIVWASPDRVTPRPDLPQVTWPSDNESKPTYTPPEGWRVANHPYYGIVVVTAYSSTVKYTKYVCCVIPANKDSVGFDWFFCKNDELTYIDTSELSDNWLPDDWQLADHPDYGRVIVTTDPELLAGAYVITPSDEYNTGFDWLFCKNDELTYIDNDQ